MKVEVIHYSNGGAFLREPAKGKLSKTALVGEPQGHPRTSP